MQINNKNTEATFTFTPGEYILVQGKDEWSLNPLIDRSYKGKDHDIGSPTIYVSDGDAEVLKKSGFSYTELDQELTPI